MPQEVEETNTASLRVIIPPVVSIALWDNQWLIHEVLNKPLLMQKPWQQALVLRAPCMETPEFSWSQASTTLAVASATGAILSQRILPKKPFSHKNIPPQKQPKKPLLHRNHSTKNPFFHRNNHRNYSPIETILPWKPISHRTHSPIRTILP